MKSFSFQNFYVAGIRSGIQAFHAGDEMWLDIIQRFLDDPDSPDAKAKLNMLMEFADLHKTAVVLNGGGHEELADLVQLLTANKEYPWAFFTEPGLNNAITSVRIILPERMYSKDADRVGRILNKPESERSLTDLTFLNMSQFTEWERELLTRKMRFGLAD